MAVAREREHRRICVVARLAEARRIDPYVGPAERTAGPRKGPLPSRWRETSCAQSDDLEGGLGA